MDCYYMSARLATSFHANDAKNNFIPLQAFFMYAS